MEKAGEYTVKSSYPRGYYYIIKEKDVEHDRDYKSQYWKIWGTDGKGKQDDIEHKRMISQKPQAFFCQLQHIFFFFVFTRNFGQPDEEQKRKEGYSKCYNVHGNHSIQPGQSIQRWSEQRISDGDDGSGQWLKAACFLIILPGNDQTFDCVRSKRSIRWLATLASWRRTL